MNKRAEIAFELFKIFWLACDCVEVADAMTDAMIEASFKAADKFIAKANLVNDIHPCVKAKCDNVELPKPPRPVLVE